MSAPNQRPTLQGQRIKTRKRDEKEKYDPSAFRDAILQGFKEAEGNLEQVSKFLDKAGSNLDYRRYAETLCDVLFAGGILAPGGCIQEDPDTEYYRTSTCVFGAENDHAVIKDYYEVFHKLIRRYKYVQKTFEAELKKLIAFLKGFTLEERQKLALACGICLANGLGDASCLAELFKDHLVKEGLSIEFAVNVFSAYLKEKDLPALSGALKRANLDSRLMELLPINKRTEDNFNEHFKAAGLDQICEYQRGRASHDLRKTMQEDIGTMIEEDEPVKEIAATVREQMRKHAFPEHDVIVMVWKSVMKTCELSKKDDLVSDQALKHVKTYAPLFQTCAGTGRAQLALIVRMQEHCYDNSNLMKAFQKFVMLFYNGDILSEEVILKWYKDGHSNKGKRVFLEQMKKFIEWLENAEEESDEED